MGRAAAGWISTVAGLAIGFAAGFGVRSCGSEDAGRPPAHADAAPELASAGGAETPHAPRARAQPPVVADGADDARPVPAASDASSVPADVEVRRVPLPGGPTGFADLVVELVDADGAPVEDATVEAAPAGLLAPSEWGWATGDTGADGRVVLHLPSPLSYDVAMSLEGCDLRTRVEVPAPGCVRIAAPPTADVRFRFAAGTEVPADGVGVWCIAECGATSLVAAAETDVRLEDPAGETVRLLGGLRYRIDPAVGWTASPGVVVPPAEVVLRRATVAVPGGTLRVRFAGEAFTQAGPWKRVRFEVRADEDPPIDDVRDDGIILGSRAPSAEVKLWVGAARGWIRWTGGDVEPGAVAYDLAASDLVDATLVPRVRRPEEFARVVLDVPGFDAGEDALDWVDAQVWSEAHVGESSSVQLAPASECTLPAAGDWLLVPPPGGRPSPLEDRVGGPVRLRHDRAVTVPYVTGGYVSVVVRGAPRAGTGPVTLVRADGAPFPFTQQGSGDTARSADLAPGLVLGPFVPGTVTLDVLVGRVRCARYEVAVRPRDHTPLVIGPFGR